MALTWVLFWRHDVDGEKNHREGERRRRAIFDEAVEVRTKYLKPEAKSTSLSHLYRRGWYFVHLR